MAKTKKISAKRAMSSQEVPPYLSIVIPLFNEAESLPHLYEAISSTLQMMKKAYEIIFVDDGSTDDSYTVITNLHKKDKHIKAIRFRRNYGKSAALSVGFKEATGKYVVTMDADLQDDPTEIPNLIKDLDTKHDLVSGWKKKRYDPISKTIPSLFFNFVTSKMTGIPIHDFNCGMKAYRQEVVRGIHVYGELHRYIPVLAHWQGFSVGEIVVHHHPRKFGKTKFGIGRFWKGFLDLLTVLFTTRYFRRPLHLFGLWGIVSTLMGAFITLWLIVEWLMGLTALGNRPLLLAGVFLIIVGVQFISIGLLGEMLSKSGQSAEREYSIRETLQ